MGYFAAKLNAQYRNNIWMISAGYCSNIPVIKTYLDFNSGVVDTPSFSRVHGSFITNTSICDTAGNLLFYTNGVNIFNANDDTMQNSIGFNPGYASTINCDLLNIMQGSLVLPMPGNDSLYYIFHVSGENFIYDSLLQQQPFNFSYSIVDMSLDSNKGGVMLSKKNIVLENDTFTNGLISACKHGNGRDWWVIIPKFYSNTYYKFLITKDTILGPFIQTIGIPIKRDIICSGLFSSNGSVYANLSLDNNLNIFVFDRCTGVFSLKDTFQIPDLLFGNGSQGMGLSFSKSGKYLYAIENFYIYQYDIQAPDIKLSETLVAQWDTFYSPSQTIFLGAQLAPDGRIYIGTWGGCTTLHYIEFPDVQGVGCNVVQNSFPISWGNAAVPYFPNYDLGVLPGSPCDTLGLGVVQNNNIEQFKITVGPNPANQIANFVYHLPTNKQVTLTIYDGYGNVVAKQNLYGTFRNFMLHTDKFANGVYYWVAQNGDVSATGKLVVVH